MLVFFTPSKLAANYLFWLENIFDLLKLIPARSNLRREISFEVDDQSIFPRYTRKSVSRHKKNTHICIKSIHSSLDSEFKIKRVSDW